MGLHTPPGIAALITVAFIIYLFRRDIRERPDISGALWLPLIWMFLTCSRSVSGWLDIFGLQLGGTVSVEEGSPLDACIYFALIAIGISVLNKRQVQLSEFARNNPWLLAFFLYCFISIAWSDFPLVAFKRWIKILGHPVMALIVLTEPNPEEGLIRLMKRCAYAIIPLCILFIKYYPEWGRSYDPWSGIPYNNGIAEGKNMLGADCLILGFFFIWHFLQTWQTERGTIKRNELLLTSGFLIMIGWLFLMAHSSTSVGSLLVGVFIVFFVKIRWVNKNLIGTYVLAGIVIFAAAEITFGISGFFIQAMGRDPTLTGRTEVWQQLLNFHTNPVFGVGFESFWLGNRLQTMAGVYRFYGNQAHNGYLEIYLTLGLLGLFVLIMWLVAVFRKIRLQLVDNFDMGRFRLGFLMAVVIYNWTEASFKTLHPVWFVFYMIAIDYPRFRLAPVEPSSQFDSVEEEMELVYCADGMAAKPSARNGG